MVKWSIEGVAAMGSLKDVQTRARDFEGIGETLGTSLQDAATKSSMNGKGGVIAQAISEFADKWKNSLPGMVKRTGDVLQGTANAVTALENGQTEMARAAQRGIQLAEGVDPRAIINSAAAAAAAEAKAAEPKPPHNVV
ncbi:hypothetical protein F1D05_03225 [Kribbella qitaiheensis]|uniref:Uncharacterized protein n=1 Tax=Kribbella qitaiheensis TaxID=1544730 RepID=A0A7G6WSY3_9ACTN|nr:DUF6507 family protein [Kribbella qitaiheensis]QNE17098.1 hypothetical protein F1D05_03225 [Kribbella qitaiheensis]